MRRELLAALFLALCAAPAYAESSRRCSRLPRRPPALQPLRKGAPDLLQLRGGLSTAGTLPSGASNPKAPTLESLKVPIAFAGWYLMSIFYSVLNKQVLEVWRFPFTFSALQLLVGALWIGMLWMPVPTGGGKRTAIRAAPAISRDDAKQLLPVATFLALGHALSTVSPAYGTVAFTNVVKTLEPLFTCALSAVFLGQIFGPLVYLSLLPVIAGVILASANEVSFSMYSLVSGLLSNLMFALRAISAKRVMEGPLGRGSLSPMNLYALLTLMALGMLLPLGLLIEGPQLVAGTAATIEKLGGVWPFVRLLLLTGVSHYTYNECAFVALSAVHPVTHAVANTVKRVAVIVVSVLYFRNPLTLLGGTGSAIAILGVLLYSLAKARDGRKAGK